MRQVEFRNLLDPQNAVRVRFDIDQGQVVRFMVQLECQFDDEWMPVIRYDTSHNFAHCDRLHPYDQATKTRMNTRDYNDALTYALEDLETNWRHYRRRFVQWREQN